MYSGRLVRITLLVILFLRNKIIISPCWVSKADPPRALNWPRSYRTLVLFCATYHTILRESFNVYLYLVFVFIYYVFNQSAVLSRGQKAGAETDHSPLLIAEAKTEWCYISASLICLHDVDRDNFSFTFTFSSGFP